jgi:hypothetical protein
LVGVLACPSIGDRGRPMSWPPQPNHVRPPTRCWNASAGYWTPRARDNDRFILTRWLDWRHAHGLSPVGDADAAALESFIAEFQKAGYAPDTILGRTSRFRRSTAGVCASSWLFATRWRCSAARHARWNRPLRA